MQPLFCGKARTGTGRRRGSALLEAALVLAVLGPLSVLAGRYAWGLYQVQTLHSAVEEAARYGASASLRDGEEPWREQVRNMAVCGKPAGCAGPRIPGLDARHVTVELQGAESAGASVRVSISGFALHYPGGTRLFEGKPSARFPRLER